MSRDPDPSLSEADYRRFRRFIRDEVDGEALYTYLSRYEKDPGLSEVFLRLAESEKRHYNFWANRIERGGRAVPGFRPSLKVRLLGYAARAFGSSAIVPYVARMEDAARTAYDGIPEAVAHGLPGDERSHARLFREIGKSGAISRSGVPIAQLEGRHSATSANALRAAVLGANDGLVSNLSLVMGVAGADPGASIVLLGGLAGLLAGALSMALGEWVSVRSAAEAIQHQLEAEAEELESFPEEEEEELTLIYRAKGLDPEEARDAAVRIIANKDQALETLAREELGISDTEAGHAWTAAGVSFLTFAVGAVLPVIPWFVAAGLAATIATVLMAGLGLFFAGAATSFFTRRGVLYAGGRMLVLGLAAAALTFLIGALVGVEVSG